MKEQNSPSGPTSEGKVVVLGEADFKRIEDCFAEIVRRMRLPVGDPDRCIGMLVGVASQNMIDIGIQCVGSFSMGTMLGNIQIGLISQAMALAYTPQDIDKNNRAMHGAKN